MIIPKLWYIRGLDLFTDASEDLYEELRDQGRIERWGHRAQIAHREEPGELQIVLRGRIELRDGATATTLRLNTGDVYGDTGGGQSDDAQLRAYDDTVVVALSRPDFEELAAEQLGYLQTQIGIVRRRNLAVPVSTLLYTTPERRLAKVLTHIIETYGTVREDEGRLDASPKARNLARLSGLADPTVSDIFDAMRRDRIVEVGKTELVIPSLDRMRELALG